MVLQPQQGKEPDDSVENVTRTGYSRLTASHARSRAAFSKIGKEVSSVFRSRASVDTLAILMISSLLIILCYHGLTRSAFGWYDEPRHMMNGVFFSDLFFDFPITDIYQYTVEYFVRFPALSLSWDLPVFSALAGSVLLAGGLEPVLIRMLVLGFAVL